MTTFFLTGSAGFIGFHLAQLLLSQGHTVHGFDALTDYYDVSLKTDRHAMLSRADGFSSTLARLENAEALDQAMRACSPDVVIHLAAQVGVRYSLEDPRSYVDTNLTGTFNVMDAARRCGVQHLLMASSSSVYGASDQMPFREATVTDTPLSIYGATKKATENMAHAYAHLHALPVTMFRFFTVYGPWGRPDMAYFKFTRAILNGTPIDVYNHGKMARDFTYVSDLVHAIRLLVDVVPDEKGAVTGDSLSSVAPFRVVNIGKSQAEPLEDFITALEDVLQIKALRNYMPMQPGDVPATWADASLLERLTGYRPKTAMRDGVRYFVDWYRSYYSD